MDEYRYAHLLPSEFRQRLASMPLAYLPLGTLEWHGEHLPLGSDAILSEGLMVECAQRFGGIVMPPVYLGPDRVQHDGEGAPLYGMDYADSTDPHRRLEGSCYWVSDAFFGEMIDAILSQIERAGFKFVFADGHFPSRRLWCETMAAREQRFQLKLLGITDDVAPKWKSQIDHAARNETSLAMCYRGELVDLDQLPESRDVWPQGVTGEDPRDASTAYGQACIASTVEVAGHLIAKACGRVCLDVSTETIEFPAIRSNLDYLFLSQAFQPDVVNALLRLAEQVGFHQGTYADGRQRNNQVAFFNRSKTYPLGPIFDRVVEIAGRASQMLDIEVDPARLDKIQVSRYMPGESYGDHVDHHVDIEDNRKLSIFCSMTENGQFSIRQSHLDVGLGDAVIFPSTAQHAAPPQPTGTRYSFVAWIPGPTWT
ncbi:MAG: hypothetical protein F4Z57_21305 [Gemmatimonadetes bacterium]|nr:hypothetical protein [Gemmatimonadota bacterium]MYC71060.1 hypothetical protein [Gemmatimonadota bacterium]MYI63980.1 hypothetical protein [Gemmatimonadota bacterium]